MISPPYLYVALCYHTLPKIIYVFENLYLSLSDPRISLLSRRANYTSMCHFQMESSISSCSPTNSPSSSEDESRGLGYDVFVQQMSGTDPYAPGYAPAAPNSSLVVDSLPGKSVGVIPFV